MKFLEATESLKHERFINIILIKYTVVRTKFV